MVANDPPLAVQLILTSAAILLPSRAYSLAAFVRTLSAWLLQHEVFDVSTSIEALFRLQPWSRNEHWRTASAWPSDRSQLLFSTVSNRLSKVTSDSLRSESFSKKKYILVQEELKDLASNRIASFVVQQTWTYVKKSNSIDYRKYSWKLLQKFTEIGWHSRTQILFLTDNKEVERKIPQIQSNWLFDNELEQKLKNSFSWIYRNMVKHCHKREEIFWIHAENIRK